MTLEGLPSVSDLSIACATRFQVCTDLNHGSGETRAPAVIGGHISGRRVAPIPGYFQTANEGAPGPSLSGTGDATDLNPESVRDTPGQSP
jgi:hypothetical protein